MDLAAGLNRRYASLAGILLAAIWCWVAFDRPYIFPDRVAWNIYSNTPQSSNNDVFDYDPYASAAIKNVCTNTQFNRSVIFTCDRSAGNIADVRNSVLHCVRYAMAGGGNLLLPKIFVIEGSDAGLEKNTGYAYELEYMFDTDHFLMSLHLSCPQMQIYRSQEETRRKPDANKLIPLVPETLAIKDESGRVVTTEWRTAFHTWLAQYHSSSDDGVYFIQLARSYLQYPISSDEPGFVQDFGKILKIRKDLRVLATTALIRLAADYAPTMLIKSPVIHKAFLGAYLTAQIQGKSTTDLERIDARFNIQTKLYLQQAAKSNLTTIYLASDDTTLIPRFFGAANGTGIAVTTKFDLLKGVDREDLLAFGPDQQALVDYLIFSRASEFIGIGSSSLSWNIALLRRQYSEQEQNWQNTADALLSDELSQVYGAPGSYPEYFASMWP